MAKRSIGTMMEKSLHASLKEWYAEPGDRLEEEVDGFRIDIVRQDLLIEIQTAGFSAIRRKLETLTKKHRVRLVHPISREKWIVRNKADGRTRLGRRKSPKRGRLDHIFDELVSIPHLMRKRNFNLEVLLVREEEIRRDDGLGSRWRGGLSVQDHRMIDVVGRRLFKSPAGFRAMLPPGLPEVFTTLDLANRADQPRWLAQKMAYCLRKMSAIKKTGKKGNALLYSV